MKVNRWAVLTAGCLIQASTGLNYSFSLLAPLFKATFGFSDSQNAWIAATINLGGYASFFSGFALDAIRSRRNLGPRLIIWIGCVLMVAGYGGMWAQAAGYITPSYKYILICAVLSGNAGTWWDTSVLCTTVRCFPDDRGTVLGTLKAFHGFSTSIYSSIFSALALSASTYEGAARSTQIMLGILATLPATLNLFGSLFINEVPVVYHLHEASDGTTDPAVIAEEAAAMYRIPDAPHPSAPINKSARFTTLYTVVALLAILQAGSTLAGESGPPGSKLHRVHALVLLLLICLVLIVPLTSGPLFIRSLRRHRHRSHHRHGVHHDSQHATDNGMLHTPLLGGNEHSNNQKETAGQNVQEPSDPEAAVAVAAETTEECSKNPATETIESTLSPTEVKGGGTQQLVLNGRDHGTEQNDDDEVCHEEVEVPPFKEMTPGEAFRQANFWMLCFCFVVGCGTGLTLLNNLAPLVVSLGAQPGSQVPFVSLFSVANAAGRLLFGFVSEYYLHKRGTPRPVFLLVAISIMTTCMLAMTLGAPLKTLYLLSMLTGFAFGGHWSIVGATTSDFFGLKSFAAIYSVMGTAPAAGALGFASWLAGSNLAAATPASGTCIGLPCFAATWRVMLAVDLVSLACGSWLWLRTRAAYSAQHAQRFLEPKKP